MYIKAAKTHMKGGEPAYSYRLVKSERAGGKVRQIALLNLGTGFSVPREKWRELCHLVEMKMSGQLSLLETDPSLDGDAERIAGKLRSRRLEEPKEPPRTAEVDLDSLEHEDPRTVGGERICLKALEDLRFREALEAAGFGDRDARIACAAVAARMLHPASERETSRWLRETSAAAELLGLEGDERALSRKTLYRIADRLQKASEPLQAALFRRERELLDIPEAIVFYDLSNVHFHGGESDLKRYGRSKQKRSDCPLATLALAIDEAGFPMRAEVLPGNVSEPSTLSGAVGRLAKSSSGGAKPTVVMDAGIASEENLEWLRSEGCHWISVDRGSMPPAPEGPPDAETETAAGLGAKAWLLEKEGGEARLYVASEGRKLKEDAILARQRQRFEAGLAKLHEGLSVKGRMKRRDRILESVGRHKEKHSKVARHYAVEVVGDDRGVNAVAVRFKRGRRHAEADEASGSCVLRTSRTGWGAEAILRAYWRLSEIEATFRSLKSELGLRPVFHQLDRRIGSHLLIAALAYHPAHLVRTRLKAQGIHSGWTSIRERMRSWVRITTTMRRTDGVLVASRQDSNPGAEQALISRAAGVEPGLRRSRCALDG